MPDFSEPLASSIVARFSVEEASVRRVLDALAEGFDEDVVGAHEEADGCWTVSIHCRAPPNEAAVRALVAYAAGAPAANALRFERIAARDWVKTSLEGLTPVSAGRFLVHGAHDRERVPVNRIGIEIEAALAFGTGHHGTTRACLLALHALAKPVIASQRRHLRVLDVGTGSGVLAMAAAKALRVPVLASDIDSSALRVARGNARFNGVAPQIEFVHAAGVGAGRFAARAPFDLVLANILLPPLRRLAAPLGRLLAPGARVVLSGLLPAQANAALAAYRAHGLVLVRRLVLDGWATLVLRRPSAARAKRYPRHRHMG